jgi:hypothetical protein
MCGTIKGPVFGSKSRDLKIALMNVREGRGKGLFLIDVLETTLIL